ncbi:MAG: hypothetical protein IAF08_01085 [Rhizobacter sp.]|nr:hypothetical protein [Chlorobiales bacterium]
MKRTIAALLTGVILAVSATAFAQEAKKADKVVKPTEAVKDTAHKAGTHKDSSHKAVKGAAHHEKTESHK